MRLDRLHPWLDALPMLRRRTLSPAALAIVAALLWASPVQATDPTIGNGCTPQGGYSARYDDGNNTWCNGSTYQYPFYVMGSAAAAAGSSCSTYPAGAMRYNTTLGNLEFCNGTTWYQVPAYATACGTPSGLSFTNLTSQSLSTVVTSSTATITFSGCSAGTALSVSVSGAATAQISINGGAWVTSGAISSGQTLQVRMTTSGSVSTVLTATVTVAATSTNWTTTTRSGSLKIFVTPSSYVGTAIGGLTGADAICQSVANTAGYSGTYKAILSDDTTSAASRLTLSYPIVNASGGSTVAASNLWVGTISNAILNPSGSAACSGCPGGDFVWTGTTSVGAIATGVTCSSWSGGSNGGLGVDGNINSTWISSGSTTCASTLGLYCIQQ